MDGAWKCTYCGTVAPPDAQQCSCCGAWIPPYGEDDDQSPQRPRIPQRPLVPPRRFEDEPPRHTDGPTLPVGTLQGKGTVEGAARNVQLRTEVSGNSSNTTTTIVCNFCVEVRNREGRPVRLVPVEMRGHSFEGAVSEGDWVRAQGQVKRGTLRVKRLHNLTTGAEVSTRSTPVAVIIVAVLLFAGWMVYVIGFAGR
ncbi:hypothetical protein [Streptomyces atratus]